MDNWARLMATGGVTGGGGGSCLAVIACCNSVAEFLAKEQAGKG